VRKLSELNAFIAKKVSTVMSSMTLFWILVVLNVGALFLQAPQGAQGWLLWGVSIFFQSIALPLLGYVSDQQGKKSTSLLTETHDTVMEELQDIKDMREKVLEILSDMKKG
jgi:hypothetical protein